MRRGGMRSYCCALFCCRRPASSAQPVGAEDVGGGRVPSPGDGVELQALRTGSNQESDHKLLERVAELERINEDLKGQLITTDADNHSSQDQIATLKSEMAALSEGKMQAEWKLAREMQKSKKKKGRRKRKEAGFQRQACGYV
mmetsp:Transcript_9598/g.16709  ORF Transcript_9598/g.16709 Transcript_9598/m.16709 type:complete len:143 (-) Transcript_9598:173-601(-)